MNTYKDYYVLKKNQPRERGYWIQWGKPQASKEIDFGEQTEGSFGRSTVDPHYLWIPYLWIHLLANIYL